MGACPPLRTEQTHIRHHPKRPTPQLVWKTHKADIALHHSHLLLFYHIHGRICPAPQGRASHSAARRRIALKRNPSGASLSPLVPGAPARRVNAFHLGKNHSPQNPTRVRLAFPGGLLDCLLGDRCAAVFDDTTRMILAAFYPFVCGHRPRQESCEACDRAIETLRARLAEMSTDIECEQDRAPSATPGEEGGCR